MNENNANHERLTCMTCGSDWSSGEYVLVCPECGGGAMERSCLFCCGECGNMWKRVVGDSHEKHAGHWDGTHADQAKLLDSTPVQAQIDGPIPGLKNEELIKQYAHAVYENNTVLLRKFLDEIILRGMVAKDGYVPAKVHSGVPFNMAASALTVVLEQEPPLSPEEERKGTLQQRWEKLQEQNSQLIKKENKLTRILIPIVLSIMCLAVWAVIDVLFFGKLSREYLQILSVPEAVLIVVGLMIRGSVRRSGRIRYYNEGEIIRLMQEAGRAIIE